MSDDPPIRLPFEPGDICIQAHANGAILVVDHGYRSRFVPLAEATREAEAARDRANQVFLAWEDDSPIVTHVVEAVRATGVRTADYAALLPPYTWPGGGSALITAAAHRQDAILDDLIARGVPLDHRDDQRATALHHAANVGNAHAVERLLAAGADRTVLDGAGRTPLALANLLGHDEAAAALDPRSSHTRGTPRPTAPDTSAPVTVVRHSPLAVAGTVGFLLVGLVAVTAIAGYYSVWAAPAAAVGWLALTGRQAVTMTGRLGIGPDRIERRALGRTVSIPFDEVGSIVAQGGARLNRRLWIQGRDPESPAITIDLEGAYRPPREEWLPDLLRRLRAAGHHIDADHPSAVVIEQLLRDHSA